MIGILRRTGFQITDSRSQTLDFWLGQTVLVCVRGCVRTFNKVERKLIQVETKVNKTLHCVLDIRPFA